MLREMSGWAVKYCAEVQQTGVPSPYLKTLEQWNTKGGSWAHWGGVIDPQCLSSFDAVPSEILFVAGELSARIGLAMLLHPAPVRQTCSVITLQIWIAGLQQGKSATEMLASWSHALAQAPQFQSLNDTDRKIVWQTLETWSVHCLKMVTPHAIWGPPNLLTPVRFSLGETWYFATIRPVRSAGPLEWLTAIQSVEEILMRHLKAASKRLRHQQVERITLSVPHIFAGQDATVREWIARFILTHEWNEQHFEGEWFQQVQVDLRGLIQRIYIDYEPSLTEKLFSQAIIELPDLFVGSTPTQIAEVSDLPIHWASLRSHQSIRKALKDCAYVSGRPSQAQIEAFQLSVPVEVRLYTTRGGTWPERRHHIQFATVE